MMPSGLPSSIQIELPPWLQAKSAHKIILTNLEDRMRLVIDLARENVVRQCGGPFAAAICDGDSGEFFSLGVNLVTSQSMSILHAEIVAIMVAQRRFNVYDFGSVENHSFQLLTSSQPCAMCLGAIPWSGISSVVFGASAEAALAIGFDEGAIAADWHNQLLARGISVTTDVLAEEAMEILDFYRGNGGPIYNGSGGKK